MDTKKPPFAQVREVSLENYLVDRTVLEGPKSEKTHPPDIGMNTVKEPYRMDRTVMPLTQARRQR